MCVRSMSGRRFLDGASIAHDMRIVRIRQRERGAETEISSVGTSRSVWAPAQARSHPASPHRFTRKQRACAMFFMRVSRSLIPDTPPPLQWSTCISTLFPDCRGCSVQGQRCLMPCGQPTGGSRISCLRPQAVDDVRLVCHVDQARR